MKGTPQMPMCGYSNFVVQTLKFYSTKFINKKIYDILLIFFK